MHQVSSCCGETCDCEDKATPILDKEKQALSMFYLDDDKFTSRNDKEDPTTKLLC